MTAATTIPGTRMLIYVGTGGDSPGSPDVFSEPCGLTTKAFNLTAATNSTVIPDCTDPTLVAWEAKDVVSLAMEVTGAGVLATESFYIWNQWFMGGTERNCRMILTSPTTAPNTLGRYEGSFILSAFTQTGERGQKVTVDVTLVNNGAVTFTIA
jgi:predicted secreted protein